MIKAALFDLDGVVVDTERQYTRFWSEMGRRYLPEIDDFATKIKGQTLDQIYAKYFADHKDEQPRITAQLNDFEQHMDFDYVPGFVDFITELRSRQVKTAIVTSSNLDKMRNLYAAHPEVSQLFDRVFTAEDFSRSKPAPECYLIGAAAFGVQPAECVGFEDSFNGLRAVRAAGMYVVGLATTNDEDAIRAYCDVVIKDYTAWIHRIPLSI